MQILSQVMYKYSIWNNVHVSFPRRRLFAKFVIYAVAVWFGVILLGLFKQHSTDVFADVVDGKWLWLYCIRKGHACKSVSFLSGVWEVMSKNQ